ncbi:hypothetical protein SLEP1_g41880 [Rubroshorea leprosula]|uniref:Uncharacterized protein n=1 Tax=Rubroshorea leprosula TaxID=152421 RepID=A0AAV5L8F3_9ROSI|nr:hypothetical protein SLEP1_g41880 [Rubroshorea leprosula]
MGAQSNTHVPFFLEFLSLIRMWICDLMQCQPKSNPRSEQEEEEEEEEGSLHLNAIRNCTWCSHVLLLRSPLRLCGCVIHRHSDCSS